MNLPKNYEFIQTKYTSSSRGTRMGRRVSKNTAEAAQYLKPPILTVGAGDGWEMEQLAKNLNILPEKGIIEGIELTKARVDIAKQHNLPIHYGSAENILDIVGDKKYNIYCAHTIEHCTNRELVIENFKKIALDTIVLIVPIEIKGRTGNRAHFSPIANLGYIANLFGMDWKVINMSYRFNIELEGLIVLKKDPMNWPKKSEGRSGELIVKGKF